MAEAQPTESAPERRPTRPFDEERLLRAETQEQAAANSKDDAQELAFQALEAHGHAEARALATEALERDPDCIDALNALANSEGKGPEEAAQRMQEVAVKAEKALGPDFIRDNKGHLWDCVEARPYLRSRMILASLLARSGKLKEALPHFQALLRFTEGDPQGVRYHLARCYASMGQTKPLQKLLGAWESDPGPVWAYLTVLLKLRLKEDKSALKALERARTLNPHVEGFLTGTIQLPKPSPQAAAPGSPEEAAAALHFLAPAWTADREAMYWLFKVGKEHRG